MKFESESGKDNGACVAYLNFYGDLVILGPVGGTVCLGEDGPIDTDYGWDPDAATHKFYPGDKLTITF